MNEPEPPAAQTMIQLPCRHMCSKEMYYEPYGAGDDQYSSGIYWCMKTQENFGPDGQPVSKNDCCPGRTCYIT
ncbi:MAG: hypothetical protein AB1813_20985 [Verrucomicrobiota bacterium]|jgi:hypothetical protein